VSFSTKISANALL